MAKGFGQYIDTTSTARVRELKKRVAAAKTNDPEELMLIIMDVLKEDALYPEIGKFYTFVYNPKTPGIEYDQHPLIACVDLKRWGFRGINFHWQKYRNYTWEEVAGKLYTIKYNELDELLSIPYKMIRLNK
jgi:hypothetical protein